MDAYVCRVILNLAKCGSVYFWVRGTGSFKIQMLDISETMHIFCVNYMAKVLNLC